MVIDLQLDTPPGSAGRDAAMDAAEEALPSVPTNRTRREALDLNVPIGCGDVPVFQGDVVVGDEDSAIVIPAQLALHLCRQMRRVES